MTAAPEPVGEPGRSYLVEDDRGTVHAAVYRDRSWWQGFHQNCEIERPITRIVKAATS